MSYLHFNWYIRYKVKPKFEILILGIRGPCILLTKLYPFLASSDLLWPDKDYRVVSETINPILAIFDTRNNIITKIFSLNSHNISHRSTDFFDNKSTIGIVRNIYYIFHKSINLDNNCETSFYLSRSRLLDYR